MLLPVRSRGGPDDPAPRRRQDEIGGVCAGRVPTLSIVPRMAARAGRHALFLTAARAVVAVSVGGAEIGIALVQPGRRTRARLADLDGAPLSGSPADFRKSIAEETEKWAKVVKLSGTKPD